MLIAASGYPTHRGQIWNPEPNHWSLSSSDLLQGVRIISSGPYIAEPFAAALAAQMGAEVIQIERPEEGDIWRSIGRKITGNNGSSVNSAWV